MNVQNTPFYKIINSRITIDELKEQPEIAKSLSNDKKIRLEFLSSNKPNTVQTKTFKNKKHREFVDNMNEFKKIYYKDYKINENVLEKIHKISEENNKFFQGFEDYNKKVDKENQKKVLSDVQDAYRKKDGYIPVIEENSNLFSNSILLKNDNDLKKYISMDLDAIKNDLSSLSFLANINHNITPTKNKLNEIMKRCNTSENKRNFPSNKEILSLFASTKNNSNSVKRKKIKKMSPKTRILALKKEITQTLDSYDSIKDLDFFLNTDNIRYLYLLKQKESRQSSGVVSTRINSGINDFDKIQLRQQTTPKDKKKDIKKNVLVEERISSLKSDNTVILPKINNLKNTDLKNDISRIEEKHLKNYKYDYTKPTEIIKKSDHKYFYDTAKKTKSSKKNCLLKKLRSPVEELYEKVSKNDDFTKHKTEVINYLKKNCYNIKPQINEKKLYYNVERNRKKIIDNTCLKNIIDSELNTSTNNALNNKIIKCNDKAKKNIELVQERLISILCDLNGGK